MNFGRIFARAHRRCPNGRTTWKALTEKETMPAGCSFGKLPDGERPGFFSSRSVLLVGIGLMVLSCVEGRGEDPIPTAFPKDRYEVLRQHSPFAVATAEAPPPPGPSFAANWFISSLARVGDSDFVTIKSRDTSTQFSLFGTGDSSNGVTLASVTWSELVGKSTVILRKGTETAKLEFNEAQIKAAPSPPLPAAGAPAAANSARPAPNNLAPRPAGNLPGASPTALPGQPGGAMPPTQIRRRPQVILPPK